MKLIDLSNVKPAGDYNNLMAGGYICKITRASDEADKERLQIEYDIADGEFKNYYDALFERRGFWGGHFIKSYKSTALGFFKAFITSVEESNPGYKWDNDEKKLENKLVGLVLGDEEYIKKDGSKGTRLSVVQTRSVRAIKDGDFKVPPKKLLTGVPVTFSDVTAKDDDFPDWLK